MWYLVIAFVCVYILILIEVVSRKSEIKRLQTVIVYLSRQLEECLSGLETLEKDLMEDIRQLETDGVRRTNNILEKINDIR